MVLVETVGFVAFAGLISAFAIWGYPKLKGEKENGSQKLLIFSQGQCGEYLLPSDRDLQRIKEYKRKQKASTNDNEERAVVEEDAASDADKNTTENKEKTE